MRVLSFVLFFVFSSPAWAGDEAAVLCPLMAEEKAMAGADYVPGVDVHGKPVVSADLDSPVKAFPDVVKLPLTLNLAQSLNINLPQGVETKPEVTVLEIHTGGRVVYNGQDLTRRARELCGKKNEEPVSTQAEEKSADENVIWGEGH